MDQGASDCAAATNIVTAVEITDRSLAMSPQFEDCQDYRTELYYGSGSADKKPISQKTIYNRHRS